MELCPTALAGAPLAAPALIELPGPVLMAFRGPVLIGFRGKAPVEWFLPPEHR